MCSNNFSCDRFNNLIQFNSGLKKLIVSFSDSFCVFNQHKRIVTSKQETGEAVADSNHGDEAKNVWFSWTEQKEEQLTALWWQQECFYDVSSALKNAAVAKSCLTVDFIVVKSFYIPYFPGPAPPGCHFHPVFVLITDFLVKPFLLTVPVYVDVNWIFLSSQFNQSCLLSTVWDVLFVVLASAVPEDAAPFCFKLLNETNIIKES